MYGLNKKLLGDRLLSGIWMDTLTPEQQAEMYGLDVEWIDRNAESWLILVDGRLWRISEDPDDGYRSHCREVYEVTNMMPVNWWQTSERVHGFHVKRWPGWYKASDLRRAHEHVLKYGDWWLPDWRMPEEDSDSFYDRPEKCELITYVSLSTGRPVCIFGTANTDDYYPMFVAQFHPMNMGINADLVDITGRSSKGE